MNKPFATPPHRRPFPTVRDRGGELRLMLILSALMSFASISTDIYLPALPAIGVALHTTPARVELTFSAFLVGFSVGQLFWGPLSDKLGRRLPVIVGLILFIIGSVGCALSDSVAQLMLWRVVQAAGACVGPVLSRAMVLDWYGREQSARVLSTLILIMGVAPLLGPLMGGQILKFWSWHAIFWSLVVIGALTLLALTALPESLPAARRSTVPLRRTLAGYLQLALEPRLMSYALAGGFFYGGVYAFIVGTPFAYIDYYHVSPQSYGWFFGINIVGMMAANFINRRLVARLGSQTLFQTGAWILAVSALVLAADAHFGWGGLWGLVLPIFFYVAMNGFIVANSVAAALAPFPQQTGAASSLLGAIHYGSGILSAALVSWLSDGTPWTMAWIMAMAGIGSLATALIALRLGAAHATAGRTASPSSSN